MDLSDKIIDVFIVKSREQITPHYIRITFHITDNLIEHLKDVREGSNNKLFIPPICSDEIYFPKRGKNIETNESASQIRTYTNRKIDLFKRELKIDFVLHKNYGPASSWAINCKPGDKLGIGMKKHLDPLVPKFDKYYLIGDHTALPIISCIIEQLLSTVEVELLLEVNGVGDEIPMLSNATIKIKCLYNWHPEKGSNLARIAKTFFKHKTKNEPYINIAAEYKTVNKLRNYLEKELSWSNTNYSAVSYWTANKPEKY